MKNSKRPRGSGGPDLNTLPGAATTKKKKVRLHNRTEPHSASLMAYPHYGPKHGFGSPDIRPPSD